MPDVPELLVGREDGREKVPKKLTQVLLLVELRTSEEGEVYEIVFVSEDSKQVLVPRLQATSPGSSSQSGTPGSSTHVRRTRSVVYGPS